MPRLAAVWITVLVAAGCDSDYDNPFENAATTQLPPADATLLFVQNGYDGTGTSPREIYAVNDATGALTRLTACARRVNPCDFLEVAASPDRRRVVARRIEDANGDGRLGASDPIRTVFIDLSRSTEGPVFAGFENVTGLDWAPSGDTLLFSAAGTGNVDDLFRITLTGEDVTNFTNSGDVRERRPRYDRSGAIAAFERVGAGGRTEIWTFRSTTQQVQVTTGGSGTAVLAGTVYTVGSDADPSFSPDGQRLVFRRLTGAEGPGTWDILSVRLDGTGLLSIATGPAYRSAPTWGSSGIAFVERTVGGTSTRLVVVDESGTVLRTPVTLAANVRMDAPRWLP